MKLAVVFEVPDDHAEAYADIAVRMIERFTFAEQEDIAHWSFDRQMRPVAAIALDPSDALTVAAVQGARREIDQPHPWIPGGLFRRGRLRELLTAFFDAML
jgi:hypothetical protein